MSREARRQLPNRAARRIDTLHALARAAAAVAVKDGIGFADLSVERLARGAGISRASFYLYFEDKGELVRSWHDEFDARVTAVFANWWQATSLPRHALSTVLQELATVYRDNRTVLAAIQEMSAHDHQLRQEREHAFQRKRLQLRRHITHGQRQNLVDPDLTPDTTAAWLISMVDRVMQQVIAPRQNDTGALIETGADIIWRTLYAAAPVNLRPSSAAVMS